MTTRTKFICFLILFTTALFAQKEGQNFCSGDAGGSYFPLDIHHKTIRWYNTVYTESPSGEKSVNGKAYKEIAQLWTDSSSDTLLLREEKGRIFQYNPKTRQDMLRYDPSKGINASWRTPECSYTIVRYDGRLETPFCNYKNLLVIRAEFESATYLFYYLRGLGYVGATENDVLVSYIMPQ